MATTTFEKNFRVPREKSREFANVMVRDPYAQNKKGYVSHLAKESDYKDLLKRALSK